MHNSGGKRILQKNLNPESIDVFSVHGMARQINWDKVEAIATVGILIFAIVAVYYAVEANNKADSLTEQSLQLQNSTLNFQPEIYPYSLIATLNDANYLNGSTGSITVGGSLNMSFIVMTPHAMILNFSDPFSFNFTVENLTSYGVNQSILDPTKMNLTRVLFYLGGVLNGRVFSMPEAFVQGGVTQVNFTVPLTATFYLNPLWFTTQASGTGTEYYLGNISIRITVYDVQTEQYLSVKPFLTPIAGWINFI